MATRSIVAGVQSEVPILMVEANLKDKIGSDSVQEGDFPSIFLSMDWAFLLSNNNVGVPKNNRGSPRFLEKRGVNSYFH